MEETINKMEALRVVMVLEEAQMEKKCYLKVPVNDGCLALVQARYSIAGVTEDLQHLRLCEAGLQPLIHQIDDLSSCKRMCSYTAQQKKYTQLQRHLTGT